MTVENAWTEADAIQKIAIQDLEHKNKELVIQIHDVEDQVASLKLEVTRLANDKLELTLRLQDAAEEVGRLSMVVKHRVVDKPR